MLIVIDCRERSLIESCQKYLEKNEKLNNKIKIISENLHIGDIIIKDDNDNDKELIIVERKTINDLASSIRDNRYNEQSYRLTECELHNHYIYYLIEGSLSNLNHRVNKQSILSAITSLSYFKGFSVYRTLSVTESAEWLIRCADKIGRETKKPFYSNVMNKGTPCIEGNINDNINDNNDNDNNNDNNTEYSLVSKREKKNNITKNNIGEIMLMQIPGVSIVAAQCIMKKYKTIKNLLSYLDKDENCLDSLKTITKTGKERNLNKNTKLNIKGFLSQNV